MVKLIHLKIKYHIEMDDILMISFHIWTSTSDHKKWCIFYNNYQSLNEISHYIAS